MKVASAPLVVSPVSADRPVAMTVRVSPDKSAAAHSVSDVNLNARDILFARRTGPSPQSGARRTFMRHADDRAFLCVSHLRKRLSELVGYPGFFLANMYAHCAGTCLPHEEMDSMNSPKVVVE